MKNFITIILILLNFGVSSRCFSIEEKTSLNETMLEAFFRTLFSDTTAGYVLFGDKPVFFCSLPEDMNLIPGTKNHKWAVEMWAGLDVWEKLSKESGNYVLKTADVVSEMGLEHELLLINKQGVLKAVQDNLSLFRYRMGLRTSPENILRNLLDPTIKITSLFNGQHTLLGIILGYGTNNAVTYERGVTLIKSVAPQPLPPYQKKPSSRDEKGLIQEIQLSKVVPGFGFSSIEEEINAMSNSLAHPDNDLDGTSTKIAFSYLKDTKESINLLSSYKEAQKSLDQVLASKNFLEQILERLQAQKVIENAKAIQEISSDLLARSIWQTYLTIYPEETVNLEDFISGMKMAEEALPAKNFDDVIVLDSLRQQRLLFPKTRFRYDKARKKLAEVATLEGVHCIESDKVYFRTLFHPRSQIELVSSEISNPNALQRSQQTRESLQTHAKHWDSKDAEEKDQYVNGDDITMGVITKTPIKKISQSSKTISAYILIQDLDGNFLSGAYYPAPPQSYILSELIPGLAYGLIGMGVKEVREIWIHPDYIFGIESDFAEGAPIKITVELIDVEDGPTHLPELIPSDFKHFHTSNEPWKSLIKRYLMFSGYRIWSHIKRSQKISLEEVNSSLRAFQKKPDLAAPLNPQEHSSLLRFHWQLYEKDPIL